MNRRFIAAALAGFPAYAIAADLNERIAAPAESVDIVRSFSWSGPQVGVHGGFQWTDAEAELLEVVGPLLTLDVSNGVFPREMGLEDSGLMGGLHGGYNVQFGMWVAGLEGDISWMDQRAEDVFSIIDPGPPPFGGSLVNTGFRTELDWLATVRIRGGVAFDRSLIYATGGLAVGEVENTVSIGIPAFGYAPPPWSESGTQWGWVVGGGFEHAFTNALSARLEYLHYDLEDQNVLAADPVSFPGQSLEYGFENSGDIVRLGLSWKF